MRQRAIVLLLVSLLAAVAAGDRARGQEFHPPYPCGYCVFEISLHGGPMKILWGNPQVAAINDISPERREVLFTRQGANTPIALFAASLDGSRQRMLAYGERGRWSPDGKRVSFERALPTAAPFAACAGRALWTVAAEGTDERLATSECTYGSTWSPDSTRLAYVDLERPTYDLGAIHVVAARGGVPQALTGPVGQPRDVSWSARGDRVAFTEVPPAHPASGHGVSAGGPVAFPTTEVAVVDLAGTTRGIVARASAPAWSPAADRLAFSHSDYAISTGYEVATGRESLRTAGADGRDVRVVRVRCCGRTKWTPDGSQLAYVAGGPTPKPHETAGQIFLSRPDGRGRRQVTHLLAGGLVEGFWFARDMSRVYVVWEFTNVD